MGAPVTVMVPRWALISLIGLGMGVLWQQERRIWACQRMAEQYQNGILKFVEMLIESSGRAQAESEAIAADRAKLILQQSRENTLFGATLGGLGMGAALLLLSDQRLKTDITSLHGTMGGCPLYSWRWSQEAETGFGRRGASRGVLAQDVARLRPQAVHVGSDGYMRVNHLMLLR